MTMVPWQEGGRTIERTATSRLWESLHGAIETLEEYQVTPDCFTHEAQRIPFGRFGDGRLTTIMTVDENFISGELSYVDSDTPEQSFHVTRELDNTSWRGNGRKHSNYGVARKLDANWPQHFIDNTAVRKLADRRNQGATLEDLFELVETQLAPNARYFTIDKIYAYTTICIDQDTNRLSAVTLRLATTEDQDNFRQTCVQLTMPYECNEHDTSAHTRAEFDELGRVSLSTWYDHPEKHVPVYVTPPDQESLLLLMIEFIDGLVEEKTATTKAA